MAARECESARPPQSSAAAGLPTLWRLARLVMHEKKQPQQADNMDSEKVSCRPNADRLFARLQSSYKVRRNTF